MDDSAGATPLISLPADLALLAWTADISAIDIGFSESTAGSGCAGDAVGFLVCDVDSSCTPADALAGVSVGDTTTAFVDGQRPSEPVQIMVKVAGLPGCGGATLTPDAGAFLELTHELPSGATSASLRIALPSVALGDTTRVLYVGADGATYADRALTTLVHSRLPRP
ncbi:MAG: hypothetical protein ACJARS_001598 [bacterium]|jgi:hypothetical protein